MMKSTSVITRFSRQDGVYFYNENIAVLADIPRYFLVT